MLASIVAFALRARAFVIVAAVCLLGGGIFAASQLDVEAYPNPIPPLIEVIAQPFGMGAEETEKYVTIPLELGLAGMPGLDHVRSQSLFGLSDVKLYFRWGTDYATARQEVINRIQFVTLPGNVQAQLSPWSAIGEIYRFTLEGKGFSLLELKTAEDFIVVRQLRQVPGVAGVTSFGGETRQYHVEIDPVRLRAANVSLTQLLAAIGNANQSVGGQRVAIGAQSFDVRGVGLITGIADIEQVVLASHAGVPVRVRDVGKVDIGPAPRLGTVGIQDRGDVVQGIVLMRYDATTRPTLDGVRSRIERIRSERILPPGMQIVPYYDRGELVATTTHTVYENLTIGMTLVAGVLFVFLGNLRAALVTAIIVPLALACAVIGLIASHTSANLLSIGAIDFGIVIDSSVVMIDHIARKLGPEGKGSVAERILEAAREVVRPMAFSTTVIGFSFVPLFTMTGVSGVIFAPMAKTYAFAIGGAIILALLLAPALSSVLLRVVQEDRESLVMRLLRRAYSPLLSLSVRRPWLAVGLTLLPVAFAALAVPHLGGEFMPKLEEGNLWIRATLPMSISREVASRYADRMRGIIRGCPPPAEGVPCDEASRTHPAVLVAVSQVGRPDDGTDVTGFNDVEIFAPLSTDSRLLRGQTKAELVRQLAAELDAEFPNVTFAFSQMISDNVDEAVAGVKGANAVKIFGPKIEENEQNAAAIRRVLASVRGVADLGTLRSLGQPNIRVTPDRAAAARYGLNAGDVVAAVQASVGGQAATRVYEGDKFFDLTVRWKAQDRESVAAIGRVMVSAPDGVQIPIDQIARVETVTGAATIYREDGTRYTPVKFSVRGRDLASTVEEARAKVAREVVLPWGSHASWTGELSELRRAEERLAIIVPLTLAIILALAYAAVRSVRDVAIVIANVPVACSGGVLALLVTGTPLSVAAAMGFVSVLGIAVQDAILVVTAFQRFTAAGAEVFEAAHAAAEERLRPVLMTALVAMLGLFPAAISQSIGAQTQKPLAIFVIGGAAMLLVLSRLLQPALLVLAHRRRREEDEPAALSTGD